MSASNDVISIPAAVQTRLRLRVDRYTKLTASNGKAIHFLAQTPIADAALVGLRQWSHSVLSPHPKVFDTLAERSAGAFVFPNTASRDGAAPALAAIESSHIALLGGEIEGDPAMSPLFAFYYHTGFKDIYPSEDRKVQAAARNAWSQGSWSVDKPTFDRWTSQNDLSTHYIRHLASLFYTADLQAQDSVGHALISQWLPAKEAPVALSLQDTRKGHFGSAALRVPLLEKKLWGNTADPDRDGRTNLAEYMEGTDPEASDIARVEIAWKGSGHLALTHPTRLGVTGIKSTITVSQNLQHWTPLPESQWTSQALITGSGSGVGILSWNLTLAKRGSKFIRIVYLEQ